jgi:hypothetical protein
MALVDVHVFRPSSLREVRAGKRTLQWRYQQPELQHLCVHHVKYSSFGGADTVSESSLSCLSLVEHDSRSGSIPEFRNSLLHSSIHLCIDLLCLSIRSLPALECISGLGEVRSERGAGRGLIESLRSLYRIPGITSSLRSEKLSS